MEKVDNIARSDNGFKKTFEKKDFLALAGILLLGAFLLLCKRIAEPEMGRDSCYYLLLVQHWQQGGFEGVLKVLPNFWFPPLHLFLVSALTFTGISPETSALAIGMTCACLMPLASFAIAHEIFKDKRISLAAALLTAVNPSVIDMAVQAQRDVPYLFAVGWCIFFIIAAIRRNHWLWWCAAGLPFAAAMLIRYETAEFLPLLGIYFVIALIKKQLPWYLLCRNLAIFALSGLVSMVILLAASGTLNYMAGSYYRYFIAQTKAVIQLHNNGDNRK